MEIIVRDIDTDKAEKMLLEHGFQPVSSSRVTIQASSGELTVGEDPHKILTLSVPYRGDEHHIVTVRVVLGYPGELCAKIDGDSILFLKALEAIGVPTTRAASIIFDE